MDKKTKLFISTLALTSVLLIGEHIVNTEKENDLVETKVEVLEESKPLDEYIEEKEPENNIENTNNNEENFYDINNLKIIEKTYKDGSTKKTLVISSSNNVISNEFADIPLLSNLKYPKTITNFYSVLKGDLLGSIETITLDNEDIYATYYKIEYDGYTITKREILKPENLRDYSYSNYSDNIEIKVYSLNDILDISLIKAKYSLKDLLKIIIELDNEVSEKIEDIITNKLIRKN